MYVVKRIIYTVNCKSFKVEKFHGFHGSISECETFACAIGFGHTRLATVQLQMFSSKSQFSFIIMKPCTRVCTSNGLQYTIFGKAHRWGDQPLPCYLAKYTVQYISYV